MRRNHRDGAQRDAKLKEWPTRHVTLLVLPGIQHLSTLAGPLDVFNRASAVLTVAGKRHSPAYEIHVLVDDQDPVFATPGLALAGAVHWKDAAFPMDTLLVLAGRDVARTRIKPELLMWLRARTTDARRVASICAGAFVLAAAGILDGRQATTHWQLADALARQYPHIAVDGDRIYTQDENIWTSAGVSAGVDLALAMVEEDHGHALALTIARSMVLYMRRGAAQRQFSAQLAAQAAEHQPIRDLIAWISEHLDGDLSVPTLARRVGMSERNFTRVFSRQVKSTPARFVARLRTQAARMKLADGIDKQDTIAQNAGFGDGETLRRHLRMEAEEPPAAVRARASIAS